MYTSVSSEKLAQHKDIICPLIIPQVICQFSSTGMITNCHGRLYHCATEKSHGPYLLHFILILLPSEFFKRRKRIYYNTKIVIATKACMYSLCKTPYEFHHV